MQTRNRGGHGIEIRHGLLLLVGFVLAAGCSAGHRGSSHEATPKPAAPLTPYSFKVLAVQKDGSTKELDFAPQEVARQATAAVRGAPASSAVHKQSLGAAGNVHLLSQTPAPGSDNLPVPIVDPKDIVQAAAAECGVVGDASHFISAPPAPGSTGPTPSTDPLLSDIATQENNGNIVTGSFFVPPWQFSEGIPAPYYIFAGVGAWSLAAPQYCDQVLMEEEAVVCTADKLAQIADAVGPITFHTSQFEFNVGLQQQSTVAAWVIPPQSEQNKFIVRDLAIDLLAHVPMVDAYFGANFPSSMTTCSQGYGVYAQTQDPNLAVALFGSSSPQPTIVDLGNLPPRPIYPPFPTDGRSLSQERLAFEAGLLRTAGQLLHDLVRESVYSDLAGATARAAGAADPVSGQVLAADADGNDPYDSLAHVARVLLGRWEMDDSQPDPACAGVPELALFPQLADRGTLARARDLGALTVNEAAAESMFERSGLVLPDGSTADLTGALTTQLVAIDAARAGGIDPMTYQLSAAGKALVTLVGQLSPSDLERGAQHNRTTFSLITGDPTNVDATGLMEEAQTVNLPAALATGTDGIAITGGLLRSSVQTDPTARSGPLMVASQCFEAGGNLNDGLAILQGDDTQPNVGSGPPSFGSPTTAPRWEIIGPSPGRSVTMLPTYAMQDVFSVGQAIRSRLVKLRQWADQADAIAFAAPGNPADRARGAAVAELGAWAGAGRVILSTDMGEQSGVASFLYVDFLGIDPADFGVSDVTALPSVVSLVGGSALSAECAAHIKTTGCDPVAAHPVSVPNVTWTTTLPTSSPLQIDGTPLPTNDPATLHSRFGVTGTPVRLTFPLNTAPAGLNTNSIVGVLANPFYLVLSQDPSKPHGTGQVLGALQLPFFVDNSSGMPLPNYGEVALALSPMRRELLNDVFGLGKWVGTVPPHPGEIAISGDPNFCGLFPRDLFVPLQNDLTDNSSSYENSWQHYLNLASAAATNADTLGQQLVDIGTKQDERIENAAEQVLTETGVPLDTDDLHVDSEGNIIPGPKNGALANLLNAPTFDAVFLGLGPASNGKQDVLSALGCDTNNTPICDKANGATTFNPATLDTLAMLTTSNDPSTFTYIALNLNNDKQGSTMAPPLHCDLAVQGAAQMKGAGNVFDPDTFTAGLLASNGSPFDNESFVLALGSTNMNVFDTPGAMTPIFGQWQVTYAGMTIMDSDDAHLWPGCLHQGNTCDFSNHGVKAFNDLFRQCPSGSETTALGTCDGGDSDAELNAIRWRVEGALWLAAAMSGDVHSGMFTSPTPAANLGDTTPNSTAPVVTFYGDGAFQAPAVGQQVTAFDPTFGTLDNNEIAALTQLPGLPPVTVTDPNTRYFHWGSVGSGTVPLWLLTLYAPTVAQARINALNAPQPTLPFFPPITLPSPGLPFNTGDVPQGTKPLVHVFANNLEGSMDFSNLTDFFTKAIGGTAVATDHIDTGRWPNIVALMKKGQCPDPTGDSSFGLPNGVTDPGWLQGLVASLKTLQKTDSEMRSPFVHSPAGLWGASYHWNGSAFEYQAAADIPKFARFLWRDDVAPVSYLYWGGVPVQGPHGIQDTWTNLHEDFWNASPNALNNGLWVQERLPSNGGGNPNARMRYALNSGAPVSNCDAAWQLTQAMALSCMLAVDLDQITPPVLTPLNHEITNINDLATVSAWLQSQVATTAKSLTHAYVAHVPVTIVANAMNVPGTLSSTAGNVGTHLAQGANALLQAYADWRNVQSSAETISIAIRDTYNELHKADTQENKDQIQAEVEKLSTLKSMADDVAEMAKGVIGTVEGGGGSADATAGTEKLAADIAIFAEIDKLPDDNMAAHQEAINTALDNLNHATNSSGAAMNASFVAVHQDINNLSAAAAALTTDKSTASYYAGKAAGAEVWNCGVTGQDPVECVSHVNTVLNRQYNGTKIRYDAALKNAKFLGYMARLAIEQRLGVHLNDITTQVGTLDPPSSWADQVCHLTGIDFQRLSGQLGPDAGSPDQIVAADETVASEFADSFIGDYVQKLTDFVQFYNVAYPEQDGNDVAVLSLRESLLGGAAACSQPSKNLLADSSRLYEIHDGTAQTVVGWVKDTCDPADTNCIQATQLTGLQLPSAPGGATWLLDQPPPSATVPLAEGGLLSLSDGGTTSANAGALVGGADDVVSQAVVLTVPGTYILSWWDRAIDPNPKSPTFGQPTATTVNAYHVGIYDSSWTPAVTGVSPVPNKSSDPTEGGWSTRYSLPFLVKAPDVFHIAFAASANNGAPGSVAIANVQLELAGADMAPSPYLDTDSSGQVTSFECARTPTEMRAAFQRNCDPDGTCHFDLTTPLVIDTQAMTSNGMPLAGKLASGNFNFRHIDVALNIVGTGVLDCSSTGSPDCFGSGFLQYSLEHDATNVGVLGFDTQYRFFDFGTATIDHAKAISAERYITTPIGSADQQLIGQLEAVQFRGRPIDGVYHLKIFDTPALRFDQIQDIQLILNYHYWSRVITSNNSN